MLGKKRTSEVEKEQHEQLEYAQRRVRQKKSLYNHFIIFLVGSVFLLLLNKVLKYGIEYNWALWGILFWSFLLILHTLDVFVTKKFMGQEWERAQREKLVRRQRERIAEMQKEIETEFPSSHINKKKDDNTWDTTP